MLRSRKSSLRRKQNRTCCLGGPAKYEVKLSWFWDRVHKYWFCFVATHLMSVLVRVCILLSCNEVSTVVALSLIFSVPGRWCDTELFGVRAALQAGDTASEVITPCWPILSLPAPGNQSSLGSALQVWEAGGKLPSLSCPSLTHCQSSLFCSV